VADRPDVHAQALEFSCSSCGAAPGTPCAEVGNPPGGWTHGARILFTEAAKAAALTDVRFGPPQDPPPELHPAVLRPPYRWHCGTCGRFVPFATVRKLPPWPGEADEHEHTGVGSSCGKVDVVWGET